MTRNPFRRQEPLDQAELARLLPAPGDPELPRDRQRLLEDHLMREIQQNRPTLSPAPAPAAPRRRVRKFAMIAVPVTAAALACVVAVNVTGSGGGNTEPVLVAAPVVQVVQGKSAGLPAAVKRISGAAASGKTLEPRADQYIYIESKVSFSSGSVNADTGEEKYWVQKLHDRRAWESPKGDKGWLIEPGYQPEGGITLDSDTEPHLGAPSYNYLKTLPTDPDQLLKKIYKETDGQGNGRNQQAFSTIGDLVSEQLAAPELSAALYRAAAKIPGVVLVDEATDAVGRTGIAIARLDEYSGERTEWIFDSKTYTYLGERSVQVRPSKTVKAGTVTARTAITERAIVDEQREAPARQAGNA